MHVPLRSAFGPELLKPWLPNIVIVEAIGASPRFRVRLARNGGGQLRRPRLTNRFLDEVILPEQYQTIPAPYLRAMETGEPAEDDILAHQFVAPDGTSLSVRRLVMPCSGDGETIDRFVVGLFLYRPESPQLQTSTQALHRPNC